MQLTLKMLPFLHILFWPIYLYNYINCLVLLRSIIRIYCEKNNIILFFFLKRETAIAILAFQVQGKQANKSAIKVSLTYLVPPVKLFSCHIMSHNLTKSLTHLPFIWHQANKKCCCVLCGDYAPP